MLCNGIEKVSIEYLKDKLNIAQRQKLEAHIKKCKRCRDLFGIIGANYDINIDSPHPSHIKESIMSHIDRDRYKKSIKKDIKFKYVAVGIIVALCVGATAFAKPIYKSLSELINTIGIRTQELGDRISKGMKAKTEEEAKAIFEMHREFIEEEIDGLGIGEVKELTFEEADEDFFVIIGKGEGITPIYYGFKDGWTTTVGEYIETPKNELQVQDMTIDQLIEEGYLIPVFERLPQGYECNIGRINENIVMGLQYSRDDGHSIDVAFGNRILIDDDQGKESLIVGEYQGVYMEHEIDNKDYGILHMYLGENKRHQVLTIQSQFIDGVMDKNSFIELAKSLKIYNDDLNDIGADGYFLGLPDKIPQNKLETFYEKVQNGNSKAEVDIEEDIKLKSGSSKFNLPPYSIEYRGSDFSKIKPYMSCPLILNKTSYDKATLESVSIIGKPYEKEKDVFVFFHGDDEQSEHSMTLVVSTLKYIPRNTPILNILLVEHMRAIEFEPGQKLVFDKDGQPYIIFEHMVDGKVPHRYFHFQTIRKINNSYTRYSLEVPFELMDEDVQQYIDNIEIIE